MNCPWAASAAAVHRRSSESLANPPARETRSARENAPSTTSTRCPIATGARVLPTRPLQPAASLRGGLAAPPPPAGAIRTAVVASAATATVVAVSRHRIGVQSQRIGRRGYEAGGGSDHRRIVG